MAGFMRFQVWRPDMTLHRCRIDTGFFPNTLLLSGMNAMATEASWLTHARVGTQGTPLPSDTDTQLYGQVAFTTDIPDPPITGQAASAPWYGYKRQTYRFGIGAGHGGENLSEAGIGWGSTGSTLISRALILDPVTQIPSTISPDTDELLDLTYELRYYAPTSDAINSVTLDGVDYDTITRASEANGSRWSTDIGSAIGQYSPTASAWKAYDGDIGTVIQAPSGNDEDCDNANQYTNGYINNSYEVDVGSQTGTGTTVPGAGWNLALGIRSLRIQTTAGSYQTQFNEDPDPRIPKDTDHTMVMEWTISWGAL
jgi:hypothetical protein